VNPGVYLFFPETNNLHLEEVDQIFRDSKNCLSPVKVAAGIVAARLQDDVHAPRHTDNEDSKYVSEHLTIDEQQKENV
jgi:hypothetical protein